MKPGTFNNKWIVSKANCASPLLKEKVKGMRTKNCPKGLPHLNNLVKGSKADGPNKPGGMWSDSLYGSLRK